MGFFGGSPDKEREPERVKGAVVRYFDQNFVSSNHQLAVDSMMESFPEATLADEQARGWLTSRGRILSEEEAKQIEINQKQRTGEDTALMKDPESSLFKEKNE